MVTQKLNGARDSSIRVTRSSFNVIISHYGADFPVKKIDNKSVENFFEKQKSEGILPSTIKKKVTLIKSLLTHARMNHGIEHKEVSNRYKAHKSPKREYTHTEIDGLFEVLAAPNTRSDWWQPWVCVIAILTGMREGEISRIRPEDIKEEDGVKYIDIWEAKSENGIRKMPVSDKLVEIGFMKLVAHRSQHKSEYVLEGYRDKEQRIMDKLSASKISQWFNRFKHKFVPEENMKALDFHSFRRYCIDTGKQSMVNEQVREEIHGHENTDKRKSEQETYAATFNLPLKLKAINEYQWQCNFELIHSFLKLP